ncbi:MAG: HD-GYP domain-containing protein [Nitrospirae bacterium]|nr:HD-GYP domain-containing protein [Nitrospirota bacterium]
MSEAGALNKFSVELINNLAIILRTTQVHDINNDAVVNQMERVAALINSAAPEDKGIRIDLVGEFFVVNDLKVRYLLEYHLNFDYLVTEFKKRKLGALSFTNRIGVADLKTFITAFISSGFSENPFDVFLDALAGVGGIGAERQKNLRLDIEEPKDVRRAIKKTYFNAVSFSKGVMTKLRGKEPVSIKNATRVIRSMVDLILEEEPLLIGMTAIKDYDEYTYHHSVNVSILSIAMGQRLGLSKRILTELGLAAFFHDIGKLEIPNEILNKPTSFTDEEWASMRQHPVWGFKAILKLKTIDSVMIRSAIASFEHHLNYDYAGYPRVQRAATQDIYSKIISTADQYDAMTSSRVYRRTAMPPDKALSLLVRDSGKRTDPLLLKLFINMVGIFPVGTFVMLSTNEFGLVYESNPVFANRPKVRVIIDRNGIKSDYLVDLAERIPDGAFARSIIKTLDHNRYKINLAEYLVEGTPPSVLPKRV